MTEAELSSLILKLKKRVTDLEISVSELRRQFEALGRAFGGGETISVDEGVERGEFEN